MSLTTLEGLKILCDVVRLRSFSRGAKMNQVTQSAASQTISHIEKRLGVQLLDRSKRPFTLTPEGQIYYEGCRDLVNQYYAVEAKTIHLRQQSSHNVSIASIYSIGLYDMNQYIHQFEDLYPGSRVEIHYFHPGKVYEHILSNKIDLGLISFPRHLKELEVQSWRKEPMVLVCHPEHPFASLSEIPIQRLNGQKFIAFDSEIDIRYQVDRNLENQGATVDIVMEFDNVEAIKRAVETGAGVSLLPEPTVRREKTEGSLVTVSLVGEAFHRPLVIMYLKNRTLTPAMKNFIDILKNQRNACVPQGIYTVAQLSGTQAITLEKG